MLLKQVLCLGCCFLSVGLTSAAELAGSDKDIKPIVKTVKLEPKIISHALSETVRIPVNSIRPFLKTSLILNGKDQFLRAPYVVASEGGELENGVGALVYVRGLGEVEEISHQVYREGESYVHPVTKELLGFEAFKIGTAELKKNGELAQFVLSSADESVEIGARIFPSYSSVLPQSLHVHPGKALKEDGYILSARDASGEIGVNQVVVISVGQREGIEEGSYLDIYQTGQQVSDPHATNWLSKKIQLPERRVGKLLVFQVYEKLSLALVLESKAVIHLLDKVKSP